MCRFAILLLYIGAIYGLQIQRTDCGAHEVEEDECLHISLTKKETSEELLLSLQREASPNIEFIEIEQEDATIIDRFPSVLFSLYRRLLILDVDLQITEITANDLLNATELTKLTVSNSKKLRKLSAGTFPPMKLRHLNLISNEIATIDDFTFANLTSLHYLRLSGNKLTKIDQNTFAGLGELSELDMSDNEIFIIESGAFADLKKLRKIDLHSNGNHLNVNLIEFAKLQNLHELNLSKTGINLGHYNFNAVLPFESPLEELNLSFNNLTSLTGLEVLRIFPKLSTLYLSRNPALEIRGRNAIEQHLGDILPKLRLLVLQTGGFVGELNSND